MYEMDPKMDEGEGGYGESGDKGFLGEEVDDN